MSSPDTKKKVFLIISGSPERLATVSEYINNHYDKPVIYTAPNGNVGLLKTKNAAIDIIITDTDSKTSDSIKMIDVILLENANSNNAIIIIGTLPEKEKFVDEIVTGKVQFIESEFSEAEFNSVLTKALNFNSHNSTSEFYLRYLSAGEILIKEGDKAEFVYILKSGQLEAYNLVEGKKVTLGNIEIGEFVGEMAYINNEPRSAFIVALTDAQLIEVPIELVDKILYKRPAWSKALMQTLSKRLKSANKVRS